MARLTSHWQFTAGYEYANSVVVSAPADPALVGLWVQQVPRHVLTFEVDYARPSVLTISAAGRWVGLQYDTNQLPLGQFFVLDAEVAHSFGHGVELFAAAQNLTNATYAITAATATAPQNDGAPITGRIGLRLQFGRL